MGETIGWCDRSTRGESGLVIWPSTRGAIRVVLKTLRDEVLADLTPQEREKFNNKLTNEAVKLARCHHPHIVRCFGSFLERGQAFIVMEFVAGDDLASLSTTTLPEEEALTYIRQVGEALTVVHGEGLVHRDIKPANIMLRAGQSEAVLIDFGVTKGFNETLTSIYSSNSDGYSALELYDYSEKAQPYSDVYGLAATLYTLLSGDVPPSAEERVILRRKNQYLSDIPGVSAETNQAIREGMALEYEDRPQTIEAFLALLKSPPQTNQWFRSLFKPKPSPPPTPPDPGSQLNLYTLYATVISIIVAIILGIFAQDIRRAIDDWFLSPGVEQRDDS